jgi:adenine-specific DNA-methyltransferase
MKGRYRADLHESPFGNKAQIRGAFLDMFEGVKASKSDLLLSYSKSDMIDRDELLALATTSFGESYHVWVSEIDYSLLPTGGRGLKKEDLDWLITAKKL